jgi:hypothetical protein
VCSRADISRVIIGIAISTVMIVIVGLRTVASPADTPAQSQQVQDAESGSASSAESQAKEEHDRRALTASDEPVANKHDRAAWMLHAVLCLGSLYLAMLITNWGALQPYAPAVSPRLVLLVRPVCSCVRLCAVMVDRHLAASRRA